ncbi:hypothetical protein OCA8868_00056 [Octadecabacter ascidiaceicola]|uniref:Uncharacterized protein n=1 Tax=Octadecabacter ascidiaceicola TaxID=1655543 RepID=A0A238JM27_9RHOB|nr:hypothetical protein OCA8868_00056 [Octadecabacter ascidiaceicola]
MVWRTNTNQAKKPVEKPPLNKNEIFEVMLCDGETSLDVAEIVLDRIAIKERIQ